MPRTAMLAIAAIPIAPRLAGAATVDGSFGSPDRLGDGPLVSSHHPAEGDANGEATVEEGDRLSTVRVQTGRGIVCFPDMPSGGRIVIISAELEGGKAVIDSHGAEDGRPVANQRAGQCAQTQ